MHLLVGLGLFAVGSELVTQRFPQPGPVFPGGDFKKEGKILAHLAPITGHFQLSIATDGVVDKKMAVEGLPADDCPNPCSLLFKRRQIVHAARRVERAGVEHVGRIVDILDVLVSVRPLDKDPAFELFEQAIAVFEWPEVCQ